MRANEFINEDSMGVEKKRIKREGSRPERGHAPMPTYRNIEQELNDDQELDERGKTSKKLCLSNRSDDELGASQLASCKSQGLRARSVKGKNDKVTIGKNRVELDGKKIKGEKYGGPVKYYGRK